jgi:hypothetical protein
MLLTGVADRNKALGAWDVCSVPFSEVLITLINPYRCFPVGSYSDPYFSRHVLVLRGNRRKGIVYIPGLMRACASISNMAKAATMISITQPMARLRNLKRSTRTRETMRLLHSDVLCFSGSADLPGCIRRRDPHDDQCWLPLRDEPTPVTQPARQQDRSAFRYSAATQRAPRQQSAGPDRSAWSSWHNRPR